MAERREGPKLVVLQESHCRGCVFHAEYAFAWEGRHFCKHESVQEPKQTERPIGETDHTPNWCPFLAEEKR